MSATGAADAALCVLDGGLHTTVQDLGRRGWEWCGVPRGGAADAEALRLANLLVENAHDCAGLEITHRGPTVAVEAPSVAVAVVGDCEVDADGRILAGEVGGWRAAVLGRGARLHLGRVSPPALRAYLAVAGGFAVEPVLGSLSTYTRARLGPLEGRPLQPGDLLPLRRAEAPTTPPRRLDPPWWWDDAGPLRIVVGPHDDRLPPGGLAALGAATYTVSPLSDRTGLLLDGPLLPVPGDAAWAESSGCLVGMVQLVPSGRLIILGCDAGTMGGFIAPVTVASVDHPRLGRLRPGAEVRFALVDPASATALRRRREAEVAAVAASLGG